jgi:segregation and condensation protein A
MALAQPLQLPVDLDLFQGPFDLLLTLLLREEIDLFELPLADLVEDALGPTPIERWDLSTASELVVLLAALAELKARRLVGEQVDEEPDADALEARERLVARLVAYAPFQRAATWLLERFNANEGMRYRRAPLGLATPALAPTEDPARLCAALNLLLIAPPEPSLSHLTSREVNMPALLTRLRNALTRGRSVSFEAIVAGKGVLEEAMTLIAALELARRGEATLRQEQAFGDIDITPTRAPSE